VPDAWNESLSETFLAHYESLRGIVRRELTARQLDAHLPPPPCRVLDVGAGDGYQGIRLARRGYDVVLADSSARMIAIAELAILAEDAATRSRVTVAEASAEECPRRFGDESFAGVLCHGVVMYQPSSTPTIETLSRLVRAGGVVSLVAKNADALALRPALQGRWEDALAAFSQREDVGGLGVSTRGDTLPELVGAFDDAGIELVAWYGLRVLTDHLTATPPEYDLPLVVEAEARASATDPYRAVGRLLHLLGRRRAT